MSESLLIAVVPVAAYLTTFFYEWRYAAYFQIPVRWIHMDLSLMLCFFLLFGLTFVLGFDMFSKVFRRAAGYNDVTPPFAWALFMLGGPVVGVLWPVGFFSAIVLTAAVEVLVSMWRRYSRRSRGEPPPPKVTYNQIPEELKRKYWVRAVVAACVWYFVVAGVLGHVTAAQRTEFQIRPGNPEVAILATYGDRLIGATFDRKAKRLRNDLHIIPMSNEIALRKEAVGPLKPASEESLWKVDY